MDVKVMQLKDKSTIPTIAGRSATNDFESTANGKRRRLNKSQASSAFSQKGSYEGETVQITGQNIMQ